MIYYYSLFTLFAVIIVMMAIDVNVGTYIVLLSKNVEITTRKTFWIMKFHPAIHSSKIGKWWMMRKYMKLAKEMSESKD